jgi:hypothetical protein
MIMFADLQRANLEVARPPGVALTVVAPTVELVGTFEVNEGLMRIDMDYGHLRAQEATATLDDAARAKAMTSTDRLIVARDHAWFAEEALWQAPRRHAGSTADALAGLKQLKSIVGAALAERVALGLPSPDGAEAWSTTWEAHHGPRPAALPADLG